MIRVDGLGVQSGIEMFIYQGARLYLPVYYRDQFHNPINVTGYTAKFQARQTPTNTEVVIELTTENGGISVNGPLGLFILNQDADITDDYPAPFFGQYDLFVFPGDDPENAIPLIWGPAYIKARITQ